MPTPLCGTSRRKLPGCVSRGWRFQCYAHTHTLTERAREGDTEGVEADGGRNGMRRNRGGMCYLWTRVHDPSSYPMVGGGPSISHCYTARRWFGSGVLATPELLTLSVTHFHFIICPLHPLITLRRPMMLESYSFERHFNESATSRRVVVIPWWRLGRKLENNPDIAACDRLTCHDRWRLNH